MSVHWVEVPRDQALPACWSHYRDSYFATGCLMSVALGPTACPYGSVERSLADDAGRIGPYVCVPSNLCERSLSSSGSLSDSDRHRARGRVILYVSPPNRNSRVAKALRDEVAEMGHRRTELQGIFEDKVAQLETRLTSYEDELRQEIVARSGMMRDLVAGELCYRQSDYGGAVEHYSSVREREPTNEEAS